MTRRKFHTPSLLQGVTVSKPSELVSFLLGCCFWVLESYVWDVLGFLCNVLCFVCLFVMFVCLFVRLFVFVFWCPKTQGMPQHLVEQAANKIPPRFGGTSPNDVFLMVKGFVSDTELCQPVLVVWPGMEANATLDALRRIASNQVPGTSCFENPKI